MVDWESGSERKRENERGFWSWKACPHITCLSLSLSLSYHMQGHSHGRWTGGQPFCLNSIYIAIWHKGSLSFTLPSNLVHISFIWLHSTSSVHVSGPIISSHVSPSLRDLGTSGEECVTHCRNSQVFTCPPSATSFFKICRNNREINMAVSNISPFNINISNHGDWWGVMSFKAWVARKHRNINGWLRLDLATNT